MLHTPSLRSVPGSVKSLAGVFSEHGYRCLLVGGALRNMTLGRSPDDFDIATDATPDVVQSLFRRTVPTGVQHGTVTVLYKRRRFEVTTFRADGRYSDARRPDQVEYGVSIGDDLSRRDFTMNAMALDLTSGEFLDPFDGRADIERRIVRTVGDPQRRFREDGLRLLRAVRFAAILGFSIGEDTLTAMSLCRDALSGVSPERVRDEIRKMLTSTKPSGAFVVLKDADLLPNVLPELDLCRGRPGGGDFDLFGHLIRCPDFIPVEQPLLRLAAVLHDIGKPNTRTQTPDGSVHYHNHDRVGAEIAGELLQRLKFSNKERDYVVHIIRHHMFAYDRTFSDAAVRRLLSRVGTETIDDLIALRRADIAAKSSRKISQPRSLTDLSDHVQRVLKAEHALSIRNLEVSGHTLAEKAGIPRGPEMGIILHELLETVIDDPSENTEEKLLTIARNIYEQRIAKK